MSHRDHAASGFHIDLSFAGHLPAPDPASQSGLADEALRRQTPVRADLRPCPGKCGGGGCGAGPCGRCD